MAEAFCPQKSPYEVKLEPGDYFWCRCGRSSKQPFCDGSHKNTGFTPCKFTVTQADTYFLCGCKKTQMAPHCDGTHALDMLD